jgi:hypothetical protein
MIFQEVFFPGVAKFPLQNLIFVARIIDYVLLLQQYSTVEATKS